MSYSTKIEIYRIKNAEFVTPLAQAPESKIARHSVGDFVIVINNEVWVKDKSATYTGESIDRDDYQKAVYSPAFVRINPSIFERID